MNHSTNGHRAPKAPLLQAEGLSIAFGGLKAVEGFSLELSAGGLCGLIGPNGAGKTTVFNLLTGVYRPDSGSLRLDGHDLAGMKPYRMTRAGVARTFQNIRLFRDLSVLDNVRLAGQLRSGASVLDALLRTPRHSRLERSVRSRCEGLLELFEMRDLMHVPSSALSYGLQRRLEIVRALATQPRVLLLDEPAAGLNSQEKRELTTSIREIRDRFGVAILLIEHDMGLVMDLCEQVLVLDHGVLIARGAPPEVQNDPAVIAAYLGAPAEVAVES